MDISKLLQVNGRNSFFGIYEHKVRHKAYKTDQLITLSSNISKAFHLQDLTNDTKISFDEMFRN